MTAPSLDTECFFITPIGPGGSEIRDRADGVMEYIVKEAMAPLGLTVVRADQIDSPGQITTQVVERVLGAKGAVADLTGANANVYYELALRHAAQLPVVLIAHVDEKSRLPFDLQSMRVIFYDDQNLKSSAESRAAITAHMKSALEGAVESPVRNAVRLQALEQGSDSDRVLADLVNGMELLRRELSELKRPAHTPAVFGEQFGITDPHRANQKLLWLGEPGSVGPASVDNDYFKLFMDGLIREANLPTPPPEPPSSAPEGSGDEV